MKNELYFENVIELGNLYLEYVFLDFGMEPIFFTCIDDSKQLYLCLCSEIRREQRWIVSKCSINMLQDLVKNNIDMASALCTPERLVLITRDIYGKENSYTVNTKDVDSLDLPQEGTKLKCDIKSAMTYLKEKQLEAWSSQLKGIVYAYASLKEIIYASSIYGEIEKSQSTMFNSVFQVPYDNVKTNFDSIFTASLQYDKYVQVRNYCTKKSDKYVEASNKNETKSINDDYLPAA